MDKIEIDKEVKKEIKRLKAIFKDIDGNNKALVDGLIIQAARLRISLNLIWEDISVNGDTEEFTQSPNTPSYERERPVARLFNNRDKNYQSIIKILTEKLPVEKANDVTEEILRFALSGKK